MSETEDRVTRLERRLKRERQARTDVEQIAEEGIWALYDANQSLDRRIAARTIELECATRRAEAASNARGAFLAHISHEVRTPLNGITGNLELLAGEIDDTQGRSWLASAQLPAERLDRLFERTLRVVQLESVDLEAEAKPIDAEDMVVAAADRWRDRCVRAGQLLAAEIHTPRGCRVIAADEAHRALDELLGNAVTHADSGSVILSSEPRGEFVRFTVDDSGPGMVSTFSSDVTPAALDPAEDPTTRRADGSGLGLALAARIAGALGGRMAAETNEMGGTRVWFELRIAPPG